MNDEIKEINIKIPGQILDYVDTKEHLLYLFNYITNLQQYYKDNVNRYEELIEKYSNLQQENDILKENNSDMQEEMTRVWEENERLKQDYINLRNYIKMRNVSTEVEDKALLYNIELEKQIDYKFRCEKASDKLGNYKHYSTPTEEQNSENEDIVDSALNILENGSEDNESRYL